MGRIPRSWQVRFRPVVAAVSYPPITHGIGFDPLPASVLGALALVTAAYLVSVYAAKGGCSNTIG